MLQWEVFVKTTCVVDEKEINQLKIQLQQSHFIFKYFLFFFSSKEIYLFIYLFGSV